MANFQLEIFAGVSLAIWTDPTTVSAASRLNDVPGHPRLYPRALVPLGGSPVLVEFRAILPIGIVMPTDVSLGGHLFTASWAQWSGPYQPPLLSLPGVTSYQSCYVTDQHAGFFQLCMARDQGGAVLVPFMVELDLS
jgi:hypothetical protein